MIMNKLVSEGVIYLL